MDITDQALSELLLEEHKDNMEISDADVSFANSIHCINFTVASSKKKLTYKNRDIAGLNEIRIWRLVKTAKSLKIAKAELLSLYLNI